MYKDRYHPSVKKDPKKLGPITRKDIKNDWIQEILTDPCRGEELSGILKGIRSFHFKIRATNYRVAYTIEENEKIVNVLIPQKRELLPNFETAASISLWESSLSFLGGFAPLRDFRVCESPFFDDMK